MYRLLRPLLFALPPDVAHAAALAALGPIERFGILRAALRAWTTPTRHPCIARQVLGLRFPSPVGLAAGFDKNALRPRALAALGFGHLELGTVTALAQEANPRPHLFRLPDDRALVNRLGFPNGGAERLAARLAGARPSLAIPTGVSIGKSRAVPADDIDRVVADYAASFDAVAKVADFVVVNVSSPNTAGLRALQARDLAKTLLAALRDRAGQTPLLVKIAPDLDEAQLDEILSVVDDLGIRGIVAVNTTIQRAGLRTPAGHIEAIGAGGLSGPPLRDRAAQVVRRVRERLGARATIIGVGGVASAHDVVALLRAGADLVQMYTGFVYEGPFVAARIARDLARTIERAGVADLDALLQSPPPTTGSSRGVRAPVPSPPR